MKKVLLTLGALALTFGAAAAQNHAGEYIASGSSIRSITPAGVVSTLWNNPGSAADVMMDAGNDILITNTSTDDALFGLDPVTLTVTTIIMDAQALSTPQEMVLDSNGDIVLTAFSLANGQNVWSLQRISGGVISTIATSASLGIQGSWTAGLVRDIDTGDFIVPSFNSTLGHPIYRITADGTNVSTLLTSFPGSGPRYDMMQDIASGDFFLGGNDSTVGFMARITPTGVATTLTTVSDRFAYNSPVMDRASSAAPRIVSAYSSTNLYYTDIATGTVTTVDIQGTLVSPRGATILYSRNISTVRTAPGQWTINYSFKNQAGKAYASALSATGVRPTIPLPDGRQIPFALDVVTFTSLSGNLAPFFNQGPNVLDAGGEATGSIDISTLGTNLGINLWLIAVVVDSAAPQGVAEIADPILITL